MTIDDLLKIDFSNTLKCAMTTPVPALMCFDKWVFRLANWEEFVKIFYYLMYQTEDGKQKIDECVNQRITSVNIKIISDNDNLDAILNPTKFSPKLYARVSDLSVMHNLLFVEQLYGIAKKYDFQLWLREQRSEEDKIAQQVVQQIAILTKKGTVKPKKERNTNYFIARINGECLTDAEKLYLRIEREFDKFLLLGDIVLSEEEDFLLKQYMTAEMKRLIAFSNWTPKRDKVFSLGLVRFAMKYYSQRTFWKYSQDEYCVKIDGNKQNIVHDVFRGIMRKYGKSYDDNLAQKIDNVNLHSFVTDKCATQLFDYLFAFWRIDLSRNILNLYGEKGKDNFKILIDEIKSNNDVSVQNVMKHTSMALALNEKSCKLRIRRILKLMDDCFWNQTQISSTGNRINELLRSWMNDSSGSFLKEYNANIRKKGKKGELLLSRPTLRVDFKTGQFIIRMPRQILLNCTIEEYPLWTVTADNGCCVTEVPKLLQGQRLYTEEVDISLPREFLFGKIRMVLASSTQKFCGYSFKLESFRFFNESGCYIENTNALSAGHLFCYSVDCHSPQVLSKETEKPIAIDNMFVTHYQVEKGDIFCLPNDHAVQVGDKIKEGLCGGRYVDGVVAYFNDICYPVYAKLPKIIFKATKKDIEGAGVIVNGAKSIIKVVDKQYHEFKLEDTLDDIYAYAIDLSDYVTNDGCYTVNISIPNNRSQNIYAFCYLRDFSYQFESAPYVFKESGSIRFDKKLKVEIDKDNWDDLGNCMRLTFAFDPESSEYCKKIHDNELYVNYECGQSIIQLRITLPIFQWKFAKHDNWSYRQPADLSRKKVPQYFYVRGPFNFTDKDSCKVFVDSIDDIVSNDEAEIYARPDKDVKCFCFNIANLKSWFTHDVVRRKVVITLNNKEYDLFDVLCRSIIKSHNLSGDFDNNVLYGYFDIVGDSTYCVDIKFREQFIAQELPIRNGQFKLETELRSDIYTVTAYEIEEDDSGFDSYTIPLGTFKQKLVNVYDLTDSIIYIKDIQDIHKKYKAFCTRVNYCIQQLERINSYYDLLEEGKEVVGLWTFDADDERMSRCIIYKGVLGQYWGEVFKFGFKVLLVFYGSCDVNDAIILRKQDDEYYELLYDRSRDWLIRNDNNYSKQDKIRNLVVLEDDKYRCRIEIEGKKV